MKRALNIWVIGGDMRQVKLAQLLEDDGHTVHKFALEHAPDNAGASAHSLDGARLADCVILPLPTMGPGSMLNAPMAAARHTLVEILNALRPGQLVCAGMVTPELTALAHERGIELRDYFAREELAIANAVPTAEGTVQIAMEELPITIHGARVLVIGYGRVGKLVAHRMHVLGARVAVAARKYADLAGAEAFGYATEHTGELTGWLCAYDLIVNTVPVRVLTAEHLTELKEGCLVIDLASKPGGVDLDAAAALGVKTIWALSLPGKVAPITAGRAIRDTIYNMLTELGI